jgi:hypothetical protein
LLFIPSDETMDRLFKIGGVLLAASSLMRRVGISPTSFTGGLVLGFAGGNATGIYAGLNVDPDLWRANPSAMMNRLIETVKTPLDERAPYQQQQQQQQEPRDAPQNSPKTPAM